MSHWSSVPAASGSRHPLPRRRGGAKTHKHLEDEQPNEVINKRAMDAPPLVKNAHTHVPLPRRPLPRLSQSSSSSSYVPPLPRLPRSSQANTTVPPLPRRSDSSSLSSASGSQDVVPPLPRPDRDAWIMEALSQSTSLVDSLNSTYKYNETMPDLPSTRRRSTSTTTDSKSPPAKRRRVVKKPTTSQSQSTYEAGPSPTFSSMSSSRSDVTSRISISPSLSVPVSPILPEWSQPAVPPKRTVPPLPRRPASPPRKKAPTPVTMPEFSMDALSLPPYTPAPTRPARGPVIRRVDEDAPADFAHTVKEAPPTSLAFTSATHAPIPLPRLPRRVTPEVSFAGEPSPTSSPLSLPPSPIVDVKLEPNIGSIPVTVKSEPLVATMPPPPESPVDPEEATSGTHRIFPVPERCRPGAPGCAENRNVWMKAEASRLKKKGLKVTRIKLLSDGLVLDWERPRKRTTPRSRSSSDNLQSAVQSVASASEPLPSTVSNSPALPPPSVSAAGQSVQDVQASTPHTQIKLEVETSTALNPVPPPSESTSATVHSARTPATPSVLDALSDPAPASQPKPKPLSRSGISQTSFAKLFLRSKMKAMEKQAELRIKMEEEALQLQEEEKRRRGEPRTPSRSRSPMLLKTPTPPWEAEERRASEGRGRLLETPPPPPGDDEEAPGSPLGGREPDLPTNSVHTSPVPTDRGTRSSSAAVQDLVYLPDVAGEEDDDDDDDDLYMDPKDIITLTPYVPPQIQMEIESETQQTEPLPEGLPDSQTETLPETLPETPPETQTQVESQPSPPHKTLEISATEPGVPELETDAREQLEEDALDWLRQYLTIFDEDRPGLLASYSHAATISLRTLSHTPSSLHIPSLISSTGVHIGEAAISSTLAGLPLTLHKTEDRAAPRIRFDLLVSFDMVVYGTSAHDRPGIMLVCYIDPTGPLPPPETETEMEEGGKQRSVCEMQFILQRRTSGTSGVDDGRVPLTESDDASWTLEILSQHITLRHIPADMDWNWC